MEVNERFIKIGKVPVTETLELGSSFQLKLGEDFLYFSCVKIEEKDNQDGTKDVIYILKHNPT